MELEISAEQQPINPDDLLIAWFVSTLPPDVVPQSDAALRWTTDLVAAQQAAVQARSWWAAAGPGIRHQAAVSASAALAADFATQLNDHTQLPTEDIFVDIERARRMHVRVLTHLGDHEAARALLGEGTGSRSPWVERGSALAREWATLEATLGIAPAVLNTPTPPNEVVRSVAAPSKVASGLAARRASDIAGFCRVLVDVDTTIDLPADLVVRSTDDATVELAELGSGGPCAAVRVDEVGSVEVIFRLFAGRARPTKVEVVLFGADGREHVATVDDTFVAFARHSAPPLVRLASPVAPTAASTPVERALASLESTGLLTEPELFGLGGAPVVRQFAREIDTLAAARGFVFEVEQTNEGKIYRRVGG